MDNPHIRLNEKLRVKIVLCNLNGEDLITVDDVEAAPGDIVSWTYPDDGVQILVDGGPDDDLP